MTEFTEILANPQQMAELTGKLLSRSVYPESITADKGIFFALARKGIDKHLVVGTPKGAHATEFIRDADTTTFLSHDWTLQLCPCTPENAQTLRKPTAIPRRHDLGRQEVLRCRRPAGHRHTRPRPSHPQRPNETHLLPAIHPPK